MIKINNKKALSDIVISVMIVLISLLAIFLLYQFIKGVTNKTSESSCKISGLDNILSIEQACYLSENEVRVDVKRELDRKNIKSTIIRFSGENLAKFLVGSYKCTDARYLNTEYSQMIESPKEGMTSRYVFNLTSDKPKEVLVQLDYFEGKEICTFSSKKEISGSCGA